MQLPAHAAVQHLDLLAAIGTPAAEPGKVLLRDGGAAGAAVVAVEDEDGHASVEDLGVVVLFVIGVAKVPDCVVVEVWFELSVLVACCSSAADTLDWGHSVTPADKCCTIAVSCHCVF
jgi:hypothetical protein